MLPLHEIRVTRMLDFIRCKAMYQEKATRPHHRRDEATTRGVTGLAADLLNVGGSPEEARLLVERKMAQRPETTRRRILDDALVLSERAKLSRHFEAQGERLERQFDYRRFPGWVIWARPDEVHYYDKPDTRQRVLRIGDNKATDTVKPWHWEEVEIFTFIVTDLFRWRGRTEMVIYPLKQGWRYEVGRDGVRRLKRKTGPVKPERRRWTPELAEQTRARIMSALIELERSKEFGEYTERPGGHCFGCIRRNECEVGKAFINQRLAQFGKPPVGTVLPLTPSGDARPEQSGEPLAGN